MSYQLYCPECADRWSGAYNTDHRCVTCGSPLKAEAVDGELERMRAERDALAEQLAEERRDDADLRDILDRAKEERDALAAHVELKENGGQEDADVSHLTLSQRVHRAHQVEHDSRFREALIDDQSVNDFAGAMKHKLMCSRFNGRHGWYDPDLCTPEFLSDLLVEHLSKGNAGTFEDVANFAMMLHQRGEDPAALVVSLARLKAEAQVEAFEGVLAYCKAVPQSAATADRVLRILRERTEAQKTVIRRQAEGGDS